MNKLCNLMPGRFSLLWLFVWVLPSLHAIDYARWTSVTETLTLTADIQISTPIEVSLETLSPIHQVTSWQATERHFTPIGIALRANATEPQPLNLQIFDERYQCDLPELNIAPLLPYSYTLEVGGKRYSLTRHDIHSFDTTLWYQGGGAPQQAILDFHLLATLPDIGSRLPSPLNKTVVCLGQFTLLLSPPLVS